MNGAARGPLAILSGIRRRVSDATLERAVSVPLALGSALVLALARWLEPAVAGHSTHLQLGLRQCTVLTWTGWPCPMCGATTSFALMADFRPQSAIANQPFAAALFLLTVFAFAVSAAEVVLPRRRWSRIIRWIEPWEGWAATGFLGGMALGWAWKAWLMMG